MNRFIAAAPVLLEILESGGYPDFSGLYRAAGFEPLRTRSMRAGLRLLRETAPAVVVAEFVYTPHYSFRISSLESLMAGIQAAGRRPRLVVLAERADAAHLDRLEKRMRIDARLLLPVHAETLRAALGPAPSSPGVSPGGR